MKKLFLIISVFAIASCSESPKEENQIENPFGIDSIQVESAGNGSTGVEQAIMLDSLNKADNMDKVNELIKSTENSDKKVKEIKIMKKENTSLKKELVQTKEELKQVKKALDSTIQTNEEKKKKGFLKTVIDNIKGNDDTTKTK